MHLLDVAVKVSFLTKLSLTLFTHKYTLTRGHKKKGGQAVGIGLGCKRRGIPKSFANLALSYLKLLPHSVPLIVAK
jgi:hypothetical protein